MIYITPAPAALIDQYAEANAQPMVSYDNLLARGTIADPAFPALTPRKNAVDGTTATVWGFTGASTLRSTLAGADVADVAFIAAHTMAGLPVTVQRLVGAVWTDTATVTPPDNQPFMMVFPRQSSNGWGLSVGGTGVIGVAWVGARLIIPGGVVPGYSEVWASREYTKLGGGTRRGHWLGQRIEAVTANLSAQFMPVRHDFALKTMRDFREVYNTGEPFIWASSPGVFGEDAAYCWAEDDDYLNPRPLAGGDLCELSMRMVAYCEV